MAPDDDDDVLHDNLVHWITRNGGSVHGNLALHTPGLDTPSTEGDETDHNDGHKKDDVSTTSTHRCHRSNRFSRRGIFAKHGPVTKGEILIRLPRHLALDGSRLPASYAFPQNDTESTAEGASGNQSTVRQRSASTWMRGLASLMQAWCQSKHGSGNVDRARNRNDVTTPKSPTQPKPINFYHPYLATLPEEYDSLLNWSAAEIQSFLAGSALGVVALQGTRSTPVDSDAVDDSSTKNHVAEDQHERALKDRFLGTVVPYLKFLRCNGFFLDGGEKMIGDGTIDSSNCGDAPDGADCEAKNPKRQKTETKTPNSNGDVTSNDFEHLYPLFREGCMCISTRAFHMQSSAAADSTSARESNADANELYHGPYLLPYVDLLNHSPRGSRKHVATLRRDRDGSFVVAADRDIAADEEICHSYDSGAAIDDDHVSAERKPAARGETEKEESTSLNSAQLLQTFGFMDVNEAGSRILDYYQRKDEFHGAFATGLGNVTPVVLTKEEICRACRRTSSSSYPDELRKSMDRSGMSDDGWEHWQMSTLEESSSRWELLTCFPDELIIPFGGSLPDELITICCIHFLPADAMNELLDESTGKDGNRTNQPKSLLFGDEVLEDYFLGKLVLRAITNLLKEKLNTYKVSSANFLVDCKQQKEGRQLLKFLGGFYRSGSDGENGGTFFWGKSEIVDAGVLSKIMAWPEGLAFTYFLQKFTYGMIISLEERACLLELKRKTLDLLVQLDGGQS